MRKLSILLILIVFVGGLFHVSDVSAFHNSEPQTDQIIIKFKDNVSSVQKENVFRKMGKLETPEKGEKLDKAEVEVRKVKRENIREAIRELKRNQEVEYAEPDYIVNVLEVPNDVRYSQQWGLTKINAEGAWGVTHGGSIAPVAILDTGVDETHPDLVGKIIKKVNFSDDPDVDVNGHGTHVAGIVGSLTNNSIGVASLGYDSKLMSVKVLSDDGSGYYSWVANGIIWATDNGAKVINLSLGGRYSSTTLRNAVDYATDRGVVVVAAAGNSNRSRAIYPAYYRDSIAVGATDIDDNKASFSNYGRRVDIAAPGVSILSTYKGDYSTLSGTSMATPFVSALASLVFANNPGFSDDDVRDKIESTGYNNSELDNYFDHGRIDACAALDCAVGGPALPNPTTSPTPTPTSTPTPTPTFTPVPIPENGLNATYFSRRRLSGRTITRVDSTVNFDWGEGEPHSRIGKTTFSVRWTGKFLANETGNHTFYTRSDDGVRLWVNGQLIIDYWEKKGDLENTGSINLEAGQKYDIKLEYFEYTGEAFVHLSSSNPTKSRQIIPSSQLFTK